MFWPQTARPGFYEIRGLHFFGLRIRRTGGAKGACLNSVRFAGGEDEIFFAS